MSDTFNYVRFQRGTQAAYNNLKSMGRLNEYTLYFIYDPNDQTIGRLYIGSRLISDGNITTISSALKDLTDVIIKNNEANCFLVSDSDGNWVSTSFENVIKLIQQGFDFSNLVTKTELQTVKEKTQVLENSLNNKVDKVIYQVPVEDEDGNPVLDENGNPAYKEVVGTLVSPEDREKLDALILDEDGSGIEISGNVNAENVQGLGSWITSNGNIYIKQLSGNNFSQDVNDKLNYITNVDNKYLTAVDGTLSLSDNAINALSKVENGSINFIKSVNTDIFTVNDSGNLDLIAIPKNVLTPVLGDISLLPNNSKNFTIVDEINNLYDIMTWSDINF